MISEWVKCDKEKICDAKEQGPMDKVASVPLDQRVVVECSSQPIAVVVDDAPLQIVLVQLNPTKGGPIVDAAVADDSNSLLPLQLLQRPLPDKPMLD